MEMETETSAKTEIHNDSINLNTKEYFREGEKEVNGAVERQINHSDLKKEPEKTKDSCFYGEQKKWRNGTTRVVSSTIYDKNV